MPDQPSAWHLRRAYYESPIAAFCAAPAENVLGELVGHSETAVDLEQQNAWLREIELLRQALSGLNGHLFLEFVIPRMGRRADAIALLGPVIAVLEFKIGAHTFLRGDLNQAWDYALDLKNFHLASHHAPIVPILVATDASAADESPAPAHSDGVHPPMRSNARALCRVLQSVANLYPGKTIDPIAWRNAPYHPTPTIIEAARALYARHSVDAIARNDAGAKNLAVTSGRVEELIEETRRRRRKTICFVTGVPGAGKTLVGLNIATRRGDPSEPTHAVFLSGNGPLVAVLREALTRDECARRRAKGEHPRKGQIAGQVKAFIQNVHHFRDEALRHNGPPADHVVIFDEAQRAWNAVQTARFMRQKKKIADFNMSEPEFLISYLDRHREWAFIVCLVGGGQEIHRGEAGISAWLDALLQHFPDWHVVLSPELKDSEYDAGHALDRIQNRPGVHLDPALHLAVSMRSFRAETLSSFVKALLDREFQRARECFGQLRDRYPIAVTRDLNAAKEWIRRRARGSERVGLVASSEALRLKPHAIDVRVKIDPVHWFLGPDSDPRSSQYLEDAASQFDIQGLELDWTCITWDADLRSRHDGWSHHIFRRSSWQAVRQQVNRNYLLNGYRVLLTRARQGMVIFVPPGSRSDPTRDPSFYDRTYADLASLGLECL